MEINFTCPNCKEDSFIIKKFSQEAEYICHHFEDDLGLFAVCEEPEYNYESGTIFNTSYRCGKCRHNLGEDHDYEDDQTLYDWLKERDMVND
jgi:transposase-like protein